MKKFSFSSKISTTKPNEIISNPLSITLLPLNRVIVLAFVGQFLILIGVMCFLPKERCQSLMLCEIPERPGLMESVLRLLK